MNVKTKDHRKAYTGPVIAAILMIAFMGAALFFTVSVMLQETGAAALLLAFLSAMLLAVALGVLLALIQRIRQIKGGEEDAAAKY